MWPLLIALLSASPPLAHVDFSPSEPLLEVAWSPDGALLAVLLPRELVVYEPDASVRVRVPLAPHERFVCRFVKGQLFVSDGDHVTALAFPSGKKVRRVSAAELQRLLDADPSDAPFSRGNSLAARSLELPLVEAVSAAVSADGKRAAVEATHGDGFIVDVATGKALAAYSGPSTVIALSDDGTRVAYGVGHSLTFGLVTALPAPPAEAAPTTLPALYGSLFKRGEQRYLDVFDEHGPGHEEHQEQEVTCSVGAVLQLGDAQVSYVSCPGLVLSDDKPSLTGGYVATARGLFWAPSTPLTAETLAAVTAGTPLVAATGAVLGKDGCVDGPNPKSRICFESGAWPRHFEEGNGTDDFRLERK